MPLERWCRVCARELNVEFQDTAPVGRAVRLRQGRHSVRGDEWAVVATYRVDEADPGILSRVGRKREGAAALRGIRDE